MKNSNNKNFKKWLWIWGCILVLAWAMVLLIFIRSNGNLTVEQLVHFTPENRLESVLVMLGLFLLKSVDFIMHTGVLCAADGIMFSLPAAMLLNTVGITIIFTTPYFMGRTLGASLPGYLMEKYPKLQPVSELRLKNDFAVALLMRIAGIPLNVASLYMGAMGFRFDRYLLGSVIGYLPLVADYTIVGVALDDAGPEMLVAAVVVRVVLFVGSVLVYRVLAKRSNAKKPAGDETGGPEIRSDREP